jgi:probable rRNA maturation factor
MTNIFINNLTKRKIKRKGIEKILKKIMRKFKEKRIISLTFCNNKFIRKLNKNYRRKDKPTDVLSFPMKENALLGDIVISADYAANNAKRYNISFSEEINKLAVHGLLHLLGFTHKKMEKLGYL